MADNKEQLFGNYATDMMPAYTTTPLQGLGNLSESVNFSRGCPDNKCSSYNSSAIKAAVYGAEAVFVCLGTGTLKNLIHNMLIHTVKIDRGSLETIAFFKFWFVSLIILFSYQFCNDVITGQEIESEDNDRSSMELPGNQLQLLKDTVAFASGLFYNTNRDFYYDEYTILDRTALRIWTICVFRVLNPHQ